MFSDNKVTPMPVRRNSTSSIDRGINLESKIRQFTDNGEITEDDGKHKTQIELMRLLTKNMLENSIVGQLYSQALLGISVLSCLQFIYQTYLDQNTRHGAALLLYFSKLELGIASLFLFDWSLQLFVADNRWVYIQSFFSVVDLMTSIPIFATYDATCPSIHESKSLITVVFYILCGLNTTRILRALRFRREFNLIEDDVQRFLATMGLYIAVMILFNAALMQYLEPLQHRQFHFWMYYMWCTIATVGYGEITPKTDLGRFAAMAMISFAIITVPKMTNDLIEMMSLQSVYQRAVFHPKHGCKHVLICGDLKSSSLREFFEELFHEDHDIQNLHAVILQPEAPSYEMLSILKDPAYSLTVTYLEGTVLSESGLVRSHVETARAVFIMTNKFSAVPDEEDAKTILKLFSIQRYLRVNSTTANNILFCLQLIRPENKRHLVTAADGAESTDLVACLNEIKMGVIAKAVMFPGANTLIMNLLTSFADDDDEDSGAQTMDDIEMLDDDEDTDWIGEYQRGCDWEIYTTELADAFEGSVFGNLSEILYQKLGVVLFALRIEDIRKDKPGAKLLLNPASYVIPSKNEFKIEAFVLAKNKAQSDLTFTKSTDQDSLFAGGLSFSHLSTLAGHLAHVTPELPSLAVHHVPVGVLKGNRKSDWQMLIRSREVVKTTESLQEEAHREEDKYLRDNYFLRDSVLDLGDALIRTSVMEEMPYVDNHIIIIGKALNNLYDLIRPLRSRHLGVLKHIVILYPSDFPIAVWQRISIFESIWIVRGSALDEADIRRAGIFKAKQVVVLADSSSEKELPANSGSAAGMDALVDADAIFCYQCVRRMNESAQVVVEIVRHTNVGYLDPESGMNSSQIDYKFTPQFASGALFASSFLDTLVCQAFYNTKIIEVVSKLIGSVDNKGDHEKKSVKSTLVGSSLYQIGIPDGLESRTYGALYKLLSNRKQIPLGILRGVFPHTKSGPKANKMPYVFTNPPKDTELFSCDKVFVLSQTPIKIGKVTKDDSKEMHMYHNIRSKKKTSEDVVSLVSDLKGDIKAFRCSHRRLEERLEAAEQDIDDKFESLFNALKQQSEAPPLNVPAPLSSPTRSNWQPVATPTVSGKKF